MKSELGKARRNRLDRDAYRQLAKAILVRWLAMPVAAAGINFRSTTESAGASRVPIPRRTSSFSAAAVIDPCIRLRAVLSS